jgi:hypothetical protein
MRISSWDLHMTFYMGSDFNTILDSIGFRKEKGYFYLREV